MLCNYFGHAPAVSEQGPSVSLWHARCNARGQVYL